MKMISIVGIVLMVLGAIGLLYGGITYTSSKDVIDAGPMHIQVDQKRQVPVSPIAGGIALAAGAVMLFMGRRGAVGRVG